VLRRTYRISRSFVLEVQALLSLAALLFLVQMALPLAGLQAATWDARSGLRGWIPALGKSVLMSLQDHPLSTALCLLPALLVAWVLHAQVVAAVARATADSYHRFPRPPGRVHVAHVRRRMIGLATPAVALCLAAVVLLLVASLLALPSRLGGVGSWLALLVLPLLLVLAGVVTRILLGLVFGSSLAVCALAIEDRSVIDALSRSFHYLFSRPLVRAWLGLRGLAFAVASAGFRFVLVILLTALVLLALRVGAPVALSRSVVANLFCLFLGSPTGLEGGAAQIGLSMALFVVILSPLGHLLTSLACGQALTYLELRLRIDGDRPWTLGGPDPAEDEDDNHEEEAARKAGLVRILVPPAPPSRAGSPQDLCGQEQPAPKISGRTPR